MILRKTTYVSALSVREILAKLSLALVWQIALASRSSAIELCLYLSFLCRPSHTSCPRPDRRVTVLSPHRMRSPRTINTSTVAWQASFPACADSPSTCCLILNRSKKKLLPACVRTLRGAQLKLQRELLSKGKFARITADRSLSGQFEVQEQALSIEYRFPRLALPCDNSLGGAWLRNQDVADCVRVTTEDTDGFARRLANDGWIQSLDERAALRHMRGII